MKIFDANCNSGSGDSGGSASSLDEDYPTEEEKHAEIMTVLNAIYLQLRKMNTHLDLMNDEIE